MTPDNYDPRTILRKSYATDITTIGREVQRISKGLLGDPKVSRDAVARWSGAVNAACRTLLDHLSGLEG
jgi:hypothetical protein